MKVLKTEFRIEPINHKGYKPRDGWHDIVYTVVYDQAGNKFESMNSFSDRLIESVIYQALRKNLAINDNMDMIKFYMEVDSLVPDFSDRNIFLAEQILPMLIEEYQNALAEGKFK